MTLSRHNSERARGQSAAVAAPLWKKLLSLKHYLVNPSQPLPWNHFSIEEEKQHLELENQLLAIEIAYLQKQLHEQQLLSIQMAQIAPYMPEEIKNLTDDHQKGVQSAFKVMQKRVHALPARIISRSLDTWNSFLWIDIGDSANGEHASPIVAKNSPVVIGKAAVGVIDYVCTNQSRVRLITDSHLTLSVRALRGGEQEFLLYEQIENLLMQIKNKRNPPFSTEEQTRLILLLKNFQSKLQPFKKTWHLAKGKLQGSIQSAKIGHPILLKGTGFNYDFFDEKGESRDLRTGKLNKSSQGEGMSILKVDDLLVTTGMDGIFPAGFQVATVTKVGSLKEGDYFYDLEATPLAGTLEELSLVFVLSPNSFDSEAAAK